MFHPQEILSLLNMVLWNWQQIEKNINCLINQQYKSIKARLIAQFRGEFNKSLTTKILSMEQEVAWQQ